MNYHTLRVIHSRRQIIDVGDAYNDYAARRVLLFSPPPPPPPLDPPTPSTVFKKTDRLITDNL